MGRKKKTGLGKSIIKDQKSHGRPDRSKDSWRHTSELNDGGGDWGRLNLQSVTEQTALDDFLATAELARTEFTAEKANITFVTATTNEAIKTHDEVSAIKAAQAQNKRLLCIPRRPAWDESTTPDELNLRERDSFLEWRKNLAVLQEKKHIILTPFETNLEVWRQLWRVIERSDVIVQIVDARNPLLFYSADLEVYAKEVDPLKSTLILVNKADLLTSKQRQMWSEYFKSQGIQAVFWSAMAETQRCEKENEAAKKESQDQGQKSDYKEDLEQKPSTASDDEAESEEELENKIQNLELSDNDTKDNTPADNTDGDSSAQQDTEDQESCKVEDPVVDLNSNDCEDRPQEKEKGQATVELCSAEEEVSAQSGDVFGHDNVLNGDTLLQVFKSLHQKMTGKTLEEIKNEKTTVGLIGYPNVGKSSSINAILQSKKVSVSATPGKTKHFQTLFVDEHLCLCDCPGLVFPSFVSTKAEMVVNGILPIDQMRDHIPPITLVCQRIRRDVLENIYGLNLPVPGDSENPNRAPTSDELLNAYGYMRGYMTHHGLPDGPRSSRYILKDFVKGKLLYCHPPPGSDEAEFQRDHYISSSLGSVTVEQTAAKKRKPVKSLQAQAASSVDHEFFKQEHVKIHAKGIQGPTKFTVGGTTIDLSDPQQRALYKPWKKHNNRNKKEKLRRVHKE